MKRTNLLEKLKKNVLLMDGAMGTVLQSRGLPPATPSALWSLERPEEVLKVHRDYVNAGAEIIFTNTFAASRNYLAKVEATNRAAVQLAREATADKAWVAGSVGPAGSEGNYREQIEALIKAGVDLLALETMTNQAEIDIAVQSARQYINDKTPLLVSMTVIKMGLLPSGENPLSLVSLLEKNGVAIIGLNCSEGPESIYPVFKKMQKQTQLPIAIKPNAGLPTLPLTRSHQGRGSNLVYSINDQEFAAWGKRFVDEGAKLIGGCCGTTPETIRAITRIAPTVSRHSPAVSG